jgi:putative ABC transport system permease protein
MFNDLIHRLRALVRRDRIERELDEELRFHLDQQIDAYVRQGYSREEATRRAAIEFGGLAQIREEHRDARGVALLDDLGRDVRHGVRQLRRSPGFALAALTCLALGIGAATTVYSVVDAILIQPLPFRDADRLVRLYENVPASVAGRPPTERGLFYREFPDWAQAKSLQDLAAFAGFGQRLVRTNTGSAGLWGFITSSNAFTMLGVRPLLGRTLLPGDENLRDVIVLSYDAWRTHFGADPSVVGRSFEFRAGALIPPFPPRLMTVVGVLPADFELPQNTSFELPRGTADFYQPMSSPTSGPPGRVTTIARLASGATLDQAAGEVRAIASALPVTAPANAQPSGPRQFHIEPLKERAAQPLRPAFRVLSAAVAVVLLIVCANVANLLLARGTSRQQELAVRVAIGASRARIVRQVMTECLVLAVTGGALGALVGAAGVSLLKRLATLDAPGIFGLMFGSTILPRAHEVGIDLTVLGGALTLAVLTSLIFGVLPALHLSRATPGSTMGVRGSSSGRQATRIRAALTVAQLTLATVLLVGAGLLVRSFVALATVDNGYDATGVLAINLLFPDQYAIARKIETIDNLLARFRAIPHVRSAGFSRHGPLIGEEIRIGVFVPPGRSLEEMKAERTRLRPVSEGFLTAMGVPLIDGREFRPDDGAAGAPVIVMSRSAARRYFGPARAVGQVLDWHYSDSAHVPVTVVGVVEDVRQLSPSDETAPEVFVDYRDLLSLLDEGEKSAMRQTVVAIGFLSFAVRTDGDPSAVALPVRNIVSDIDPNIGIDVLVPMTRLVSTAIAPQRFYAVLLGVFAAIAGVLAIVGIYSVLAYAVAQRTQEIGIRLSLGAPRMQVLGLVLRTGVLLTAIGIALGSLGAAATAGVLRSLLFGITPLDATTFAIVPLAFSLVAMVASYVPARRATRIDPIVALRQE